MRRCLRGMPNPAGKEGDIMYEYTHNDGRTGRGWSTWAAIVAAIGPADANALPDLANPVWNYDHGWGERYSRVSPVLTTDGVDLGTVRESRD